MKVSFALTLDSLVTALRYRGYAVADEIEDRLRRGDVTKTRGRPQTMLQWDEVRGAESDDVASN